MKTIRGRLLLGLLLALAALGLAGGAALYVSARNTADEVFDQQLQQTALSLRDQSFEYALTPDLSRPEPDAATVIQVWTRDGVRIYASRRYSELPGLAPRGFSTVPVGRALWRTYALPARGYVIQVAQPLSVRRQQAARFALRVLAPLAAMLPAFALLIGLIVRRGLAPLERLADALRRRRPTALDPVPAQGLPGELAPVAEALNELLARLDEALQQQRAFIDDAAHELRTPLTALRLQLQLAEDAAGDEERALAFRRLSEGVTRATRLVEQLLSLARLDAQSQIATAGVSLPELAREAIAEAALVAEAAGLELSLHATASAEVSGDEASLRTLIANLLSNALRYTPRGGHVEVTVARDGEAVVLAVRDDGPGIPETERERVFDRFYRAPGQARTGTGLGLAIVRRIAERHGASLTLGPGLAGRGVGVRLRFAAAPAGAAPLSPI